MEITNRQIAKAFRLVSQLMELHEENPFKVRSLQNAAFKIEKIGVPLSEMDVTELASIEGIGKGLQTKITDFITRGSFTDLDELAARTPMGVVEMLSIKGIGPKKVAQLWKELEIESVGELLYACNENRLVSLKGFGEKTQKAIQASIEFRISNSSSCLFPIAEQFSLQLKEKFAEEKLSGRLELTGQIRRRCEVITSIDLLTTCDEKEMIAFLLKQEELIEQTIEKHSVEICGRALEYIQTLYDGKIQVRIFLTSNESFTSDLFLTTSSDHHLEILKTNYNFKSKTKTESESAIYSELNLPYFIPELREEGTEFTLIKNNALPELVELNDLRGILHNHSTYSDGNHSLKEMAEYCKELGFEYLGMCDHSKSAFYANGLKEEAVIKQQAEIDKLNSTLSPFKIFKGIESDILFNGELDYNESILKNFDFIVASIHSNLKMDKAKATQRLIKAIENPFTTILGHPTGRLLLSRPGYEIDHAKVIDACAENGVSIELNANPYRLDIDWRWISYALERNVMISINPDAHRKEGYHDMYYGVGAARKGGLTRSMTMNALSLEAIEKKFAERKR